MPLLKAICLIFLVFLSQYPIHASDEITGIRKYSINFIGLEMMKMEATFHMNVVQGQEE